MTDSNSHNLKVSESVCENLGTEHSPSPVTYNIHVLLMFQRKAEKIFQNVHDSLIVVVGLRQSKMIMDRDPLMQC